MAFPENPIYKFVETTFDGVTSKHVMKAESDVLIHIPLKEGRTSRYYEEYLEWVAKGNTAEAAD
tara:strand:+ start:3557 stop:3748 length:192 start_codon:yes stop_codon:yes gene_type:complete